MSKDEVKVKWTLLVGRAGKHSMEALLEPKKVEAKAAPVDRDRRLKQRQRQIEIGKATYEYRSYLTAVPKNKRSRDDPRTPNPFARRSKRSFDGSLRVWRRRLHHWDQDAEWVSVDEWQDSDSMATQMSSVRTVD